MTAAIHGLTLDVAGPATHRRRYLDGRPVWHCSETDGPCQGHGAAPSAATTSGARWCPKGLHQGEMRQRSDKDNAWTCRGCERARERARRSSAYDGRKERAA